MSRQNQDKTAQPDSALCRDFFSRSTLDVARALLGITLVRRQENGSTLSGRIVEVEAYTQDDPACHAYRGLTDRTRPMFGEPGHAYVYFIYGMYHCLNVVTEPSGEAGAVLIRAVEAEGTDGPGKLCRQWSIDKSHNDIDMTSSKSEIYLVRSEPIPESQVLVTPRIGISRAKERPWRFLVKDNASVSKPARSSQSSSSGKRKKKQSKAKTRGGN